MTLHCSPRQASFPVKTVVPVPVGITCWPSRRSPNMNTLLFQVRNAEWLAPAATYIARSVVRTISQSIGENTSLTSRWPSCPNRLSPQEYTLPSFVRQIEWFSERAIYATCTGTGTIMGSTTSSWFPKPRRPPFPFPNVKTYPDFVTAILWNLSVSILTTSSSISTFLGNACLSFKYPS